MNSGRRIAAVVLTAAISFGGVAFAAGPAEALRDTTWPSLVTPGTTPGGSDTTWPTVKDTTWPTVKDTTWPTLTDTTWPSGG